MPKKIYIDENGYERYKDSNKLVHRHKVEKKLGRKLKPGEVVHHKDRNKLNNSPDNLWVFRNQEEHDRIHKLDAKRHGKRASYKGFGKASNKANNSGCTFILAAMTIILTAFYFLF